MGAEWVIPALDMKFGCAVTQWPSPTKAKLVAIWIALLVILSRIRKVSIYTDSQVAIDSITVFPSLSIRQRSKVPNTFFLQQIWRCINIKNLRVDFVKVKGHSGIHNDVADEVARTVGRMAKVNNDFILHPNALAHSETPFSIIWRNRMWNGHWRRNFNTLVTLPHYANWARSMLRNNHGSLGWFDNNFENSIPPELLRNISKLNITHLLFSYL